MAGAINNPNIDSSNIYTGSTSTAPAKKDLDRDAFLKILITQMQYQDPTQPMQDKEFIAQMAQFSSLEQMNKVSEMNSMMLGTQMIGKTITYMDTDGTVKSGDVTGMKKVDGIVNVLVGDKTVDLANIQSASDKA